MCGIAGVYAPRMVSATDRESIERMNDIQQHRGPDDEGLYYAERCILGHRRLSIIDLSKDGHEPFASDDGRYYMTYNGEIYNYIELRRELCSLGWTFRTKTDKEVLMKAYQQFGIACLEKFNGMFAFAIYDTAQETIFLARDHFGIKPLYYTEINSKYYFASEIKALRSLPDLKIGVNYQAIFDFFVFSRTDVFDETFIHEIKRLPKGYYAIVDQDGMKLTQWWKPEAFEQNLMADSIQPVTKRVEELFASAVEFQMRSDVQVGSCLSGGLDSSILTGILFDHRHVTNTFDTFTASFPEHPIDETRYVDDLNKKYPFSNHKTFPTAQLAFDNFHQFVHTIDDPVTDASAFSQYEVMRLARQHGITVLLDGQGGDENFAGYQYFHGFYLYGLLRQIRLGKFSGELLKVMLRRQDRSAFQALAFQFLPDVVKKRFLLHAVPSISEDFFESYVNSSLIYNEFFNAPDLHTSLVRHFQYKLEHLLRIEDRNSMAFSIEARVPYLDHRLVEYVLGVNDDFKIKSGVTKHLQKLALGRYTTPNILNRKDKIGFGTPMDKWMATPLWRNFTDENDRYLGGAMQGIMKDKHILPAKGNLRWKVNHLAEWHRMVFG
jgi:asparagine synthase (glutamine-hydrolysing)